MGIPSLSPAARRAYGRKVDSDWKEKRMKTYVILRRAAWTTVDEVAAASERSLAVRDEMHEEIRWLRSYVLDDPGGTYGVVCVYQAASPEAVREHAARAGMPADEIIGVTGTIVITPDVVVADSAVTTI